MNEIEDPVTAGIETSMKLDHATGLCGGIDVPSGPNVPLAASLEKFGSRPRAIRSRVNV
jgi:hypothetical protein